MLKINFEKLIGIADDYFYENTNYEKAIRTGQWHSMSEREQTRRSERSATSSEALCDMAAVIGADVDQIITLARSIRKFYEKTRWEKSFYLHDHAEQIEQYISKPSDEWYGHYRSTGRKIKA